MSEEDDKVVQVKLGPQHFEMMCLIGEGAFGKVLLVQSRLETSKKMYAMKVISKKLLIKKNHISYMQTEREIMSKVQHPFVVPLRFAFQSESKLFLVMDFLSGGELFYHLRKNGVLMEREARFYMAEIILGLEFLHSKNIVHRDLKPENILLTEQGHVCITDFGLAKETKDSEERLRTLCGTSEYMAPEMILRSGYGKPADWWSFGALTFEMLVGRPPFQDPNPKELDRKILSEKLVLPPHLATETHNLLKGLLNRDVTKRLGCVKSTMFQIGGTRMLKSHPFFAETNWDDVYRCVLTPPLIVREKEAAVAAKTANAKAPLPLLSNFDTDFVNQHLSPSLIEDSVFGSEALNTPMVNRSRVVPGTESSAPLIDVEEAFVNFDYVDPAFRCTEKQIELFQAELQVKMQKERKKRLLRDKREMERLQKAAIEAAIKAEQEERERVERERAAEEEARRAEAERRRLSEERKIQALNEALQALRLQHAAYQEYAAETEKLQKTIRQVKKKLREIDELETKLASGAGLKPSKEQAEKLKKKPILQEELEALVEEEKERMENAPPVPPPLPETAAPSSQSCAETVVTPVSPTVDATPLPPPPTVPTTVAAPPVPPVAPRPAAPVEDEWQVVPAKEKTPKKKPPSKR